MSAPNAFVFGLITVVLTHSALAYAQSIDREKLLSQTPPKISLDANDRGGDLPSRGSSLLDKMFSKDDGRGNAVYDIPYPFDRFIDRLAGRTQPHPRKLTRIRNLKNEEELKDFLVNDLFIRASEETQEQEVLFPFGRSLQKPREGNAITNPWQSPREIITLNTPKDPHIFKTGKSHARIYCGFVENLKMMECISWNSELGRYEFQLIEDYEAGKTPKVTYVNRAKCLACHQGGAPIFPQLDWLESDDSLALEPGIILSNYAGLSALKSSQSKDSILSAINQRIRIAVEDRQRQFEPTEIRFRQIKAGKFDEQVGVSNKILSLNKLWIHLCGNTDAGNECRRTVFKAYMTGVVLRQNKNLTPEDIDQQLTQILAPLVASPAIKEGHLKVSKAVEFFPFFSDRDPLTAIFNNDEIIQCATGECTWGFLEKLISPASLPALVSHGQQLNSFFNPKFLQKSNLIKKEQPAELTLLDLAKGLSVFFYAQRADANKKGGYSDIGSWFKQLNSSDQAKMISLTNQRIDSMDPRYFAPAPLNREKLLFGLWDGVDNDKAAGFYKILTQPTPPKVLHGGTKPVQFDLRSEPQLFQVTLVCTECHGSKSSGSIPQFAYATSKEALLANIFYYRESILDQLERKNMPPRDAILTLSDTQRVELIEYVKNLKPPTE